MIILNHNLILLRVVAQAAGIGHESGPAGARTISDLRPEEGHAAEVKPRPEHVVLLRVVCGYVCCVVQEGPVTAGFAELPLEGAGVPGLYRNVLTIGIGLNGLPPAPVLVAPLRVVLTDVEGRNERCIIFS